MKAITLAVILSAGLYAGCNNDEPSAQKDIKVVGPTLVSESEALHLQMEYFFNRLHTNVLEGDSVSVEKYPDQRNIAHKLSMFIPYKGTIIEQDGSVLEFYLDKYMRSQYIKVSGAKKINSGSPGEYNLETLSQYTSRWDTALKSLMHKLSVQAPVDVVTDTLF